MSPRISKIRTTSFRLDSGHFGRVHLYRPGEKFSRAWELLARDRRYSNKFSGYGKLPYSGLATALQVLSGDLVLVNKLLNNEKAFIVSRKSLDIDELAVVVRAWETNVLKRSDYPLSSKLDDLQVEEGNVSDLIHIRKGMCPIVSNSERWVWQAALWEVAYRFMQTPLETDIGPVSLRMDSDANLLTWDNLIWPDNKNDTAAMHKVSFKMITIPGIEEPVASITSRLARLAPGWRETGGARFAWAALGEAGIIMRAAVHNFRKKDNSWETNWADNAVEVLRGASLDPLPNTLHGPSLTGALRTGYKSPPKYSSIGRGVGTWFHECVAHHARKVLGPDAEGVELIPSLRGRHPTREKAAPRLYLGFDRQEAEPSLRLFVVYAGSETRLRIRNALAHILNKGAHEKDCDYIASFCEKLHFLEDNKLLGCGPVQVQFIKPDQAGDFLLRRNKQNDILDWMASWMPAMDKAKTASAAIVETDAALAQGKDGLSDPKVVLRSRLAHESIVTQFITKDTAPRESQKRQTGDDGKFRDYAAANAIRDVMRSAGFFLRPFPEINGFEGTIVVGIYTKSETTGKKGQQFMVNLVAVELGTSRAWGYIPYYGWSSLHKATACFLDNEDLMPFDKVRSNVEKAIEQLTLAIDHKRMVLLFNSSGCRRFWPCLSDKGEDMPLPAWMTRDKKAVVRVRSAKSEVPWAAGANSWDDGFSPAKYTSFRPMTVQDAQGNAPAFILSGSAVMDQGRNARESTRFAASPGALKEDWHVLGVTELLVKESGEWHDHDLLDCVAMLCRISPTWQRTLRWPSPLHLARAVVQDHPHANLEEDEGLSGE